MKHIERIFCNQYPFDLSHNVKIERRLGQYERTKYDSEGNAIYTYRHVLKTFADTGLMVLRTSPLYTGSKPILNSGHKAKEIVYVLEGSVIFFWENKYGEVKQASLFPGDSVYISPMVPHGFATQIGYDSQILAVDF